MTQPILRVLIQEKLANGGSLHTHVPSMWAGPRNGETLDGCEETVTKAQTTLPPRRTHPAVSKGLLRGLTLAAFAALGTMTFAASAGAATPITSCPTTLSTFGETYVLANDLTLTSCGACLVVNNDRITIDLAGKTISVTTVPCSGAGTTTPVKAGVTDGGTPRQRTTVKNGKITGFEVGVNLADSTRNLIRNLESSANSVTGISVGDHSNVKGCVLENNGGYGIISLDFVEVQDCTITGNVSGGINGGHRMLVTDTTVEGNGVGILVGDFSTVSFNTSSDNTSTGLFVGNNSLVTGNTTIGNGTEGITTGELSTVSHNSSNRNGEGGVVAGNHSWVTGNITNWNGNAGIATGGLSTVSHNSSNDNVGGGIGAVDASSDSTRSWVAGNTTDRNGGIGVEASCPSTVTNNRSSDNGCGTLRTAGSCSTSNYIFNGPGLCLTKNNTENNTENTK